MVDPEQALSSDDVTRMAVLHVESIEDSLPTLLGVPFAASLYRFLERSERELVFIERVDARVESVCVVSFEPESLQGRIARATLAQLAIRSGLAFVSRGAFRRLLWHTLKEALTGASPGGSGGEHEDKSPEITYVFTNSDLRGKRLGQRIVARVDAELSARGFERYFVKTIDDPSNRAVRFYAENGFERIAPRVEGGRTFVEFHKLLVQHKATT